ncbi:MAG TPA: MMPL family transporter [Nannocystaceae bacterium]|nr:MMPL family transporter [Nannocystaceae bacterium]
MLPPVRSRWPAVVLLVLAACAVLLATRMKVSTAITQFAVDGGGPDSRWIEELGTSEPARTMVFTVEHEDLAHALAVARTLGDRLIVNEEVERVTDGAPSNVGETLYELYFPRRWRFVDRDPLRVDERLSDEGLARAAAHLKTELARPSGAAVKRVAADDPLLVFPALLHELGETQRGVSVEGDRLVSADGRAAILLVTTRHGPFEGKHQLALDDAITALVAELSAKEGVTIERSALHRFAIASERAIRSDVQLLSTISSLGVVALLLLAYRSLRALLLAAVPIIAGMLVATAVTLLLHGRIHGLTLAFGSTLIGVCVDYPVHLFSHHFAADHDDGRDAHAREDVVWSGLWLASATTIVAFAALLVAGLPGLREIGMFAATGVVTALVTTRVLVRPWLPRTTPREPAFALAIERVLGRAAARPRAIVILAIVVGAIGIGGLTRAQWVDDVRALDSQLPVFHDEDQRVRARVEPIEVGRLLLCRGATVEDALAVQDQLWTRLRDAGLVASVRGAGVLLRARATQDASLERVHASPALADRLRAALAQAGFDPRRFADPQATADPGPLGLAELEATGLGALVRPFVIERDDGAAVVAFVRADADTAALAEAAAQVPGASWFDQRRFVEALAREHREATTFAVALGMLAVVVLLAIRWRRIDRVLATLLPAALAGTAALGMLAWAGVQLHLMHLVACLLVLGIGVDYGVFMAEAARAPRSRPQTVLGIAIACATTVWSFGVLGTSKSPAIGGLGLTVAIGVALAALLAPLAAMSIDREDR